MKEGEGQRGRNRSVISRKQSLRSFVTMEYRHGIYIYIYSRDSSFSVFHITCVI